MTSTVRGFFGGFSSQNSFGSSYGGGYSSKQSGASQRNGFSGTQKSNASSSAHGFSRGGFSNNTTAKKSEPVKLDYKVGDTVEHKTFGQGLIINANSVGGDMVLEIAFDNCGTKKIMAKMAKLKKL